MNKRFIIDALGIGLLLWVIGYALGMMLFMYVPADILGWIIFAIATPITIAISYYRLRKTGFSKSYYVGLGTVWMTIAIVFDYLFLVMTFTGVSYYKIDVFVYYALMLVIPIAMGLAVGKK